MPVARNWDSTIKGTCWNPRVYVMEGVVSGGLQDLTPRVTGLLIRTSIFGIDGCGTGSLALEDDLEVTDEEEREVCNSTGHVYGRLVCPAQHTCLVQ